MKRFLSSYWKTMVSTNRLGLTILFGLAVFFFWRIRYPFALTYQEQFQLFLFDGDYFTERIVEPGGLARYVGEFLVQFYNSPALGAFILAVLFMLVQLLTWLLMRSKDNYQLSIGHYPLSFIPAVFLWYALGDESIMLAYVVAQVIALAVCWGLARLFLSWGYEHKMLLRRLYILIWLIPLLYWAIGPMVVLTAFILMPVSVIYVIAMILLSAHYLPYPMTRVMTGICYYRSPEVLSAMLIVIPIVTILVSNFVRLLPKAHRMVSIAEASVVTIITVCIFHGFGYGAKKYELMEYDQLVRIKDWKGIIAKAEKQTPDLPMSVSATNLALAMTNQLGERAFDFYQRGSEGLLPPFERNFSTIQLTGEIYFYLGLINTAQRFAFEAMEGIPDYNKSGRMMKRLAETNLINGEYEVARKYLLLLDKTIFYRPWAQQALAMLEDVTQIDAHPIYGTLRQFRLADDFLFSEDELDKICGQLFMHNPKNQMATQYLVMAPLLDGDAQRFINYVSYVQSKVNYNPRYVREAIAKIRTTR